LDSVKNPIKDASVSSAVPQSMFPELVGMVDSMKSALSKLNDIELENQRESDPIPEPVVPPIGTVLEPVMKDIKDLLQQLNTHMESVKTNTATQTDIGNKQINAIQKLSGNRFA
jgi:ABC-type iron transport system FetAB permease component